MSLSKKLLSLAAEALLVEQYVEEAVAKFRMSICLTCDRRDPGMNRCLECGCMLDAKTKSKLNRRLSLGRQSEVTHCPLGKWDDLKIANEYRKLDGLPPLLNQQK